MINFFYEFFEWIVGAVLGLILVLLIIGCLLSVRNYEIEKQQLCVHYGYHPGDIEAFIRVTDFNTKSLLDSSGARKAFERYVATGEISPKKKSGGTTVVPLIVPMGR